MTAQLVLMLPRQGPRRATLVVSLDIKTINPNNGMARVGNSQTAAIIQSQKDARQRRRAYVLVSSAMRTAGLSRADLVPCVVTLTRISAGRLDKHDGIQPALKHVVDGIADALGINDGGEFVAWRYDQRRGPPKHFEVEVQIERAL